MSTKRYKYKDAHEDVEQDSSDEDEDQPLADAFDQLVDYFDHVLSERQATVPTLIAELSFFRHQLDEKIAKARQGAVPPPPPRLVRQSAVAPMDTDVKMPLSGLAAAFRPKLTVTEALMPAPSAAPLPAPRRLPPLPAIKKPADSTDTQMKD